MSDDIVNRVANSVLITINLEDFYPIGQRNTIDLKQWLFQESILKEKDFREFVKQHNWLQYQDCYVSIHCSVDAIIPIWAYMLVSSKLNNIAKLCVIGSSENLEVTLFQSIIDQLDTNEFKDKRVIIKGCSNLPICTHAYASLTNKLIPIAKSIMYGEACSSVPIYKRK